jgi:hypothetical protein
VSAATTMPSDAGMPKAIVIYFLPGSRLGGLGLGMGFGDDVDLGIRRAILPGQAQYSI